MITYISNNNNEKRVKILITKLLGEEFDGVFNYIYNLIQHINLDNAQVDLYISAGDISSVFIYPELKRMGINIFIGNESKNRHSYKQDINCLNQLIKKNKYNTIYINSGHPLFTAINVMIAKKNKVQRIVTHSHNSVTKKIEKEGIIKKILFFFSRIIIDSIATDLLACSDIAGNWLYGKKTMQKKGIIIKNGIDVEKYIFNQAFRIKIRNMLKVPDESIIIGLTANFTPQKNHIFLLQIFAEFFKLKQNSFLLLLGDGEKRDEIINEAKKLNIYKHLIITGSVPNANEYYNAMDVFLMPSLHEGLPYVAIEAQTNCIPCFFSDVITDEINITDNTMFISLEKKPNEWAKSIFVTISNYSMERRIKNTTTISETIKKAGFDANQISYTLCEILGICNKEA